jgi:hypothetical protein
MAVSSLNANGRQEANRAFTMRPTGCEAETLRFSSPPHRLDVLPGSLCRSGGELASTGLSTSHVLSGDSRLAALVLAAVIDYNLPQSPARREDIEYVERIFALFRQATRPDWASAGGRINLQTTRRPLTNWTNTRTSAMTSRT